jgi:hypothetical protein
MSEVKSLPKRVDKRLNYSTLFHAFERELSIVGNTYEISVEGKTWVHSLHPALPKLPPRIDRSCTFT